MSWHAGNFILLLFLRVQFYLIHFYLILKRGIDVLKNDAALKKEGVTEENFHEMIGYYFTTSSTDGREVELKVKKHPILLFGFLRLTL